MQINAEEQKKHASRMDALVLGHFEDAGPKRAAGLLSAGERSKVIKVLGAKGFKGKKGEDVLVPMAAAGCDSVLVVGLGKEKSATSDVLRKAAARVVSKSRSEKWSSIRLDYGTFALENDGAHSAQALAEGLRLSGYSFDRYKSEKKENEQLRLESVEISLGSGDSKKAVRAALDEAEVLTEGVCLARDLGNEPPNVLYPESYAARIRKAALDAKLKCRVFDEKKLAALKMGGILGVGQGSVRKPRLVTLEYKPAKAKNKKPIVLVGKGITFDTGGISIKPSKDMEQMKFDMCGSAAVVAAIWCAAKLKLPLYVIGITPLAENMPGGGAQRPGDTIRCYNGKTVDVLNTDAEGRLILADALAYAKDFDPKCIVDIATLTGACAYFFDYVASGLMGTDADVNARLMKAGEKTGERLWELPLWEEYDEMVKGSYGDVQNVSRASAGAITAASFLKHFGGHSPWAHLDVAGTAWSTSGRGYNPMGATGVGVRLFVEFLKSYI